MKSISNAHSDLELGILKRCECFERSKKKTLYSKQVLGSLRQIVKEFNLTARERGETLGQGVATLLTRLGDVSDPVVAAREQY